MMTFPEALELLGAVVTIATALGHVIPGPVGSWFRKAGIDLKGMLGK
jgi:hypothetical protein